MHTFQENLLKKNYSRMPTSKLCISVSVFILRSDFKVKLFMKNEYC